MSEYFFGSLPVRILDDQGRRRLLQEAEISEQFVPWVSSYAIAEADSQIQETSLMMIAIRGFQFSNRVNK